MSSAALYRFFDVQDCLLYVGKAVDPFDRLKSHLRVKPDMTRVRHIEIEWFETEADALVAEKRAIETERPLWNDTYRRRPRSLTTTTPVVTYPVYLGPPRPDRVCRLTTSPKGIRDRTDWQGALRISRDGDIIEIHDVEVPRDFYKAAMDQGTYFVHC